MTKTVHIDTGNDVMESSPFLDEDSLQTDKANGDGINMNLAKEIKTQDTVPNKRTSSTGGSPVIGGLPSYGWSVPMTHTFPETWIQNLMPRISQIFYLLPMVIRFLVWRIILCFKGRTPFIDMFTLQGKQIYGVPIGGIGSGSIGRGFKGEFCRFQMTPGLYTYNVVHANQFIISVRDEDGNRTYQKVLTGTGDPGTLSTWDWTYRPEDGSYLGLYPRAVYTYMIPEENLVLKSYQTSPVIPHNYKDSSLPACSFTWVIENNDTKAKDVSITFTFKNGTGSKNDRSKKCATTAFQGMSHGVPVHGVALEQIIEGIQTTYGIGCLEKSDVTVTHMISFDLKHGSDLWAKLCRNGRLDNESCSYEISKGEVGIAINSAGFIKPGANTEFIFTLVWDQPIVKFKGGQHTFTRRYTRYISRDIEFKGEKTTTAAVRNLIGYTLSHFREWDQAIDQWQNPILKDVQLPDWFKSAIFNELYFVSDGGSIWFEYERLLDDKSGHTPSKNTKEDLRTEYGRFGYLEGHEYRMYNTYDVHFYSSFALCMLWPKLQLSLQYDFAETIPYEDPSMRIHLFDGHRGQRKVKNSVPHDLGDPWDEPYAKINSYLVHDVSEWRDLNLKFVLQVFRDYKFTRDIEYLKDMLPPCIAVMKKSLNWDKDGDGLIENSGSADQTYDTWVMTGPSAYCGGLWLASLFSIVDIIKTIQDSSGNSNGYSDDLILFQDFLSRAKVSYEQKLWTGSYYKFDSSRGPTSDAIMADQLCGHWFLSQCDVDDSDIFPTSHVTISLRTIYDKNVLGFCNGELGAANGMNPDGTVHTKSVQSEETWTGVTYGLAATMISSGMTEEGFKTAEGIYRTVYEKIGMGFETPEALVHTKRYRAMGYMRPLSIWSLLNAWNRRTK